MSIEGLKRDLVPKFIANGEEKFYRSIIFLALQKLIILNKNEKILPPHIEYLNYCDLFIVMYRREGDEVYLDIARMLRKAANKIYRIMLKRGMTKKDNRFLNVVG